MKILVFTEGTILIHSSIKGFNNYKNYFPIGNAQEKIQMWSDQGAEIFYLTSRETADEIADIKNILKKYNFPYCNNLLFKKNNETYKDIAEKLMPDILIEDDCESIGGKSEMTYTNIRRDLKQKIKSIIVREFSGIDNLPNNLSELIR